MPTDEQELEGLKKRIAALEWLVSEDDLVTAHLAINYKAHLDHSENKVGITEDTDGTGT